jgi:hypothetical protein
MKKIMLSVAIVATLAGCAASAGHSSDAPGSIRPAVATPKPAPSAASARQSPAPQPPTVLEADGWQMVGNSLKASLGSWSGTVRLRNTADHVRSALVTVTVLPRSGEDPMATMSGAVNHVGPGKIATVSLISGDKYKNAQYRLALDVTSVDA